LYPIVVDSFHFYVVVLESLVMTTVRQIVTLHKGDQQGINQQKGSLVSVSFDVPVKTIL